MKIFIHQSTLDEKRDTAIWNKIKLIERQHLNGINVKSVAVYNDS